MALKLPDFTKLIAKPTTKPAEETAARSGVKKEAAVATASVVPKVVVVGGAGFGGLAVARALADSPVQVHLLDRSNFHGFWPLLYQVATAGLEPESIATPVRAIVRKYKNVDFQLANVERIDFENRQVITDMAPVSYDYLVIAAGSTNNFFGNQNLAERTFGLKDVEEAVDLRNRILSAFELAVRESDPARRQALLTFVVVGGGPTGVELAGAFAELIRQVLRKDYPMLDISQARIKLIEAHDRLLAPFAPSLQRHAIRQLERMGVEVLLNTAVERVEEDHIRLKDGSLMPTYTVAWAAGVRSAEIADSLGVKLVRMGRVPVEPTLQLPGHPEVFVIGDMAYLEGYKKTQPYPMVAQVAMQQGKRAAHNILAQVHRKPLKPFHYFDKGSMATIGRSSAVLDASFIRLTGLPAWIAWLVVHLFFLIGSRNRLVVLLNWAYSYFTFDRGARLILGLRAKPALSKDGQ